MIHRPRLKWFKEVDVFGAGARVYCHIGSQNCFRKEGLLNSKPALLGFKINAMLVEGLGKYFNFEGVKQDYYYPPSFVMLGADRRK